MTHLAVENFFGYVLFPIWLAAGFADWLFHRWTRIETASGVRESALHAAMIAEMGMAVLVFLMLEINAATLLLLIGLYAMHEVLVYWDLAAAHHAREVPPLEQLGHGIMEAVPMAGLAVLCVANWDQLAGLVGTVGSTADLSLRWRELPFALATIATVLSLSFVFVVAPFAEEMVRCLRAVRWASPTPIPQQKSSHHLQDIGAVTGPDSQTKTIKPRQIVDETDSAPALELSAVLAVVITLISGALQNGQRNASKASGLRLRAR